MDISTPRLKTQLLAHNCWNIRIPLQKLEQAMADPSRSPMLDIAVADCATCGPIRKARLSSRSGALRRQDHRFQRN